ncbi:MAG: ParA family protein [Planctomycetes bacterium]|nr:ParA family protein [Planctomycetota bacterium]
MRKIAIINQKGGVGKTTTSVNLGAALAEQGRRVVLVDMDPQANLSLHLGLEVPPHEPSAYTVLHGATKLADSMRDTGLPGLRVVASNIDLSGAELELASAIGRDNLLSDAIELWCNEYEGEGEPADYVIFDCPPSLGLLSINALAAANEVLITVQTEFLALMGMSKLVEVVNLIRRRLNPTLTITGIAACLYDSRLRLAREVLGEVRQYFPGQVFRQVVRSNVKLAEAPSFGASIIEYAPESNGARDYRRLALEVIEQEAQHPELAHLAPPRTIEELPTQRANADAGAASPAPAEELDAQEEDGAEREPVKTLAPQPPPAGAPAAGDAAEATPKKDAVDEELRVMRAQDLPPLPPEAFELPPRR